MAGVETGGDIFCFCDADGRRKGAVEGAAEIFRGDGRPEGEACHLREGMNAGVGATGAWGERRFAGDPAESCLQLSLDGALSGLNLPAAVIGAVVGEGEF